MVNSKAVKKFPFYSAHIRRKYALLSVKGLINKKPLMVANSILYTKFCTNLSTTVTSIVHGANGSSPLVGIKLQPTNYDVVEYKIVMSN